MSNEGKNLPPECVDLNMCDSKKEEKTNSATTVSFDRITAPGHKPDNTDCKCEGS